MREIKFRAWHKGHESKGKMREIPGRMIYDEYPGECFNYLKEGQPVHIMQFTGIKDKNGCQIFEGDIIELFGDNYIIVNVYGCFYHKHIKQEAYGTIHTTHLPFRPLKNDLYYEVIGNIHEHPHLIK